jgi:hypothetical protein
MTRWLVPLVTLLVGLTLGLGASALAGERTTRQSCDPRVISACSTLSNWCYYLRRQMHSSAIEDPEVRGAFRYFRISCVTWRGR